MPTLTASSPDSSRVARDLGAIVEAFESALARDFTAALTDYLPPSDHPGYLRILCELVRVDLDQAKARGLPRCLGDYRPAFPALFADPSCLAALAYEEYRLRRRSGENPLPAEYRQRYGIDTEHWPAPLVADEDRASASECADRSGLRIEDRLKGLPSGLSNGTSPTARGVREGPQWWLDSLSHNLTEAQRGVQDEHPSMAACLPEVGAAFLGFHLLEELGRGAFGKVFLARQSQLADRLVVLKITTDVPGEPHTLAQLQHTNIVPIYSIHFASPFQVLCMPYFGATTLADLLRRLHGQALLPSSGHELVEAVIDRRSRTRYRRDPAHAPVPEPTPVAPGAESSPEDASSTPAPPPARRLPVRDYLSEFEHMSFVNSVLWLAVRLADGLNHAHERGILHRDLKPANVLLTDEGQPMLLDFNLSEDTKLRGSALETSLGGTLPYMAPEHLAAFRGGASQVDARSDIYSLGIILYELLTGRPLYPNPEGLDLEAALERMQQDRSQPPPRLRPWNKAVSPAVESIVRRCLKPDPARRYQSARELQEDLDRHLHDLPLLHATEPSWLERSRKFQRRHPRLSSATTVGILAGVVLLGLSGLYLTLQHRAARLEAQETLRSFEQQLQGVQFLLKARTARDQLDEGLRLAQDALQVYQLQGDPQWERRSAVRSLPADEQARLREQLGELLMLQAHAWTLQAAETAEPGPRHQLADQALNSCNLAQTCYLPGAAPPSLWKQQAEALALLGRSEEARLALEQAAGIPLRTSRDFYLAALLEAEQGRFREALGLLREACRRQPQDFNNSFLEGICHDYQGRPKEAIACYRTCIALRPEFYASWFNRGLAYLREGRFTEAAADFDQVVHLRPDFADAYVNRAAARQGLGDHQAMANDLTRALDLGYAQVHVYLLRARARQKLGDAAGAEADRAEAFRLEPADERDWIARGIARLPKDPGLAVADFDHALRLNPRSLPGLQNKAHALSKYLRQTEDAIRVLDDAIEHYPDDARPRAGRGVLRARLGQRKAALEDAGQALIIDGTPANLYQVAGIYALTSQEQPEDRQEAYRLLSAALLKGFGFDLLDSDPDLDPIRSQPQFKELVEAARAIRAGTLSNQAPAK